MQRLRENRVRFWGRLRLGEGTTTLAIERREEGSDRWEQVFTAAPDQAPADRFTVDGRESFNRFGRAPRESTYRYRLRYFEDGAWRAGMQVTAVR